MSYGVWRKHGKGWSSIEIDNAGIDAFYQWMDFANKYGEVHAKARKRMFSKMGLGCDESLFSEYAYDDFNFLQWAYPQKRKGWEVYEVNTKSDHNVWISVVSDEVLKEALTKLSFSKDTKVYSLGLKGSEIDNHNEDMSIFFRHV